MVYWEVHTQAVVGRRSIQSRFLKQVSSVIPNDSVPIIVTDAGFHAPWFRCVRKLGWDYVGRVRAQVKCSRDGYHFFEVRSMHQKASTTPRDLGWFTVSKSTPIQHRLVLVRKRKKSGKKRKAATSKQPPGPSPKGKPRRTVSVTEQSNRHRVSAQQPWVLATSLNWDASGVVAVYKKRMQTEETYRDLKSVRCGWQLSAAHSKKHRRLNVLLLIAALAAAFVMASGAIAESDGLARGFQANTTHTRRVLSLYTLGRMVLQQSPQRYSAQHIANSLATIVDADRYPG